MNRVRPSTRAWTGAAVLELAAYWWGFATAPRDLPLQALVLGASVLVLLAVCAAGGARWCGRVFLGIAMIAAVSWWAFLDVRGLVIGTLHGIAALFAVFAMRSDARRTERPS